MFLIDLFFAFLVALLIAVILAGPLGWRHPRGDSAVAASLFLFILLLAVVWAIGAWMTPYGPPLWGSYWLPFLFVGVMVALVILAIGAAADSSWPPDKLPPKTQVTPDPEIKEAEAAAAGAAAIFGVIFWILLIAAIAAIIAAYVA